MKSIFVKYSVLIFLTKIILSAAPISSFAEVLPKEYWGSIFCEDKKVGYFNYRIAELDKNEYELKQVVYRYPSEGISAKKESNEVVEILNKDLSLKKFTYKDSINEGDIVIDGVINGQNLTINITRNGYTISDLISIKKEIYSSAVLPELIAYKNLKEGKYEFDIFEEELLEVVKAKIDVIRKFETLFEGRNKKFFEVEIINDEYSNFDKKLIIDEDGKLVNGSYLNLNILVKAISESEIEKDRVLPKIEKPSIPSDTYILDIDKVNYLIAKGYSLSCIRKDFFTENDEQKIDFENNNYDIVVKIDRNKSVKAVDKDKKSLKKYIADSIFIETKDSQIQSLAKEIAGADTNVITIAQKIIKWINDNIKKESGNMGFYSARDILKLKQGDCTEYATLFCALSRSLGIPVKGVFGLVYQNGSFSYHMWNKIYDNGIWVSVDAPKNQVGFIDAGHMEISEIDFSFKTLALFNYQIINAANFTKFDIVEYRGSKGIAFKELAEMPRPNLQNYPNTVLPAISTSDIKVENPVIIGSTFFEIGDLPDEYKSINIGLEKIIKRNLLCIKKFSILEYENTFGDVNYFSKSEKELGEACEKMGTDYLLIGKISGNMNNNMILKTAVFSKKEKRIIRLTDNECRKDDFLKLSQKVIFELTKKLEVNISKEEEERIKSYYFPAFENFLLFCRGFNGVADMSEDNLLPLFEVPIYSRIVLKEDPRFVLAYKTLGDFLSLGNLNMAIYFYNEALKLDPYDAECYWDKYMLLINAYELGDLKKDKEIYDETKILLEKALNIAPYYAMAHLSLGSRYSHNGDYDKALEETLKAKILSPKSDDVYYNLGIIYVDKGVFVEAEKSFKECLVINEKSEEAYVALGNLYLSNSKIENAIEIYKKGLSMIPDSAELNVGMAESLIYAEDMDQAVFYARKALELDKNVKKAHDCIGLAFKRADKVDDAIKEFQEETEVSPDDFHSYERLGFLFSQKKKDSTKAVFYYKKAIELGTNNGCAYNNLAWYSILENTDINKTIDWAKKGVELKPDHYYHLGSLGWAYYKNGKYDDAIKTFEKLSNVDKIGAVDTLGMGLAYFKKGENRKAKDKIKEAFDKNPQLNEKEVFKKEEAFIESEYHVKIRDIAK